MASAKPSALAAGDKTMKLPTTAMIATSNPFVGKDFSGFEDPKITVARRREQEKGPAADAYKAPTEPAGAVYSKGNDCEPLKLGENLWDPKFSSVRRNNIIGGWVARSRS